MSESRRATLPQGVTLRAERGDFHFTLTYWGTMNALIAVGCLTPIMLANRTGLQSGREQCDDHGQRFTLHRAGTKAEPDRMKLGRLEIGSLLPGVRELFPEGCPGPRESEPADADAGPTMEEWKGERSSRVHQAIGYVQSATDWLPCKLWSWSKGEKDRFQFANDDAERMASIVDRFVGDMQAAIEQAVVVTDIQQRPGHRGPCLRIVVNNEFAGGCTP